MNLRRKYYFEYCDKKNTIHNEVKSLLDLVQDSSTNEEIDGLKTIDLLCSSMKAKENDYSRTYTFCAYVGGEKKLFREITSDDIKRIYEDASTIIKLDKEKFKEFRKEYEDFFESLEHKDLYSVNLTSLIISYFSFSKDLLIYEPNRYCEFVNVVKKMGSHSKLVTQTFLNVFDKIKSLEREVFNKFISRSEELCKINVDLGSDFIKKISRIKNLNTELIDHFYNFKDKFHREYDKYTLSNLLSSKFSDESVLYEGIKKLHLGDFNSLEKFLSSYDREELINLMSYIKKRTPDNKKFIDTMFKISSKPYVFLDDGKPSWHLDSLLNKMSSQETDYYSEDFPSNKFFWDVFFKEVKKLIRENPEDKDFNSFVLNSAYLKELEDLEEITLSASIYNISGMKNGKLIYNVSLLYDPEKLSDFDSIPPKHVLDRCQLTYEFDKALLKRGIENYSRKPIEGKDWLVFGDQAHFYETLDNSLKEHLENFVIKYKSKNFKKDFSTPLIKKNNLYKIKKNKEYFTLEFPNELFFDSNKQKKLFSKKKNFFKDFFNAIKLHRETYPDSDSYTFFYEPIDDHYNMEVIIDNTSISMKLVDYYDELSSQKCFVGERIPIKNLEQELKSRLLPGPYHFLGRNSYIYKSYDCRKIEFIMHKYFKAIKKLRQHDEELAKDFIISDSKRCLFEHPEMHDTYIKKIIELSKT